MTCDTAASSVHFFLTAVFYDLSDEHYGVHDSLYLLVIHVTLRGDVTGMQSEQQLKRSYTNTKGQKV